MNILKWLEEWYKTTCDGDWEQSYGIDIRTLDNPGWSIKIDLKETSLEGKEPFEYSFDEGDHNWFCCRIREDTFYGYGDPEKLEKIIMMFQKWVVE